MKSTLFSLSSLVLSTSLLSAATVPKELKSARFSGPETTPCPAVICAAPTGEVFVGVDMQGSLGKKANLGKIVRLVDSDGDGKVDQTTDFAKIDNPRGLISLGDKLIVLHSTVKDGKPYNQNISVYTDADNDGIADAEPKTLVKGIGNPVHIQKRGADHCTNNIRLGIDGWIYIAVGDFGFVNAEGADGKKLTMLGGGVVRVRPDGSEMEEFIHGTRNVYDIAIDPFMNVFTRENTNDGVGWWIRFSHYIQSGEYGYPSLYTNFPEDMLPALGEYGRGSGTGGVFLQEPSWPKKYNNQVLMTDWGTQKIYIHRLKQNGASFTNIPEEFIGTQQVADVDMDASGRMYIANWAGAGYLGNPKKGFVDLVVPKGWKYVPFPKLSEQSEEKLLSLLKSESITARTYASQELVTRKASSATESLIKLAKDTSNSLESRVAAIYTLTQINGIKSLEALKALSNDTQLREHAIRCMADRKLVAKNADVNFLIKALKDENPRVQVAAAVALGRTNKAEAAKALLAFAKPVKIAKPTKAKASEEKKDFKSKVITKLTDKADIKVDISDFQHLTLIVNPEGHNANDHVVWVNPTITTKDGTKIELTKEKWLHAKSAWGKVSVNKDCTGRELGNGISGIGTHALSKIEFKLPDGAQTFTATGMFTKGSKGQGKVSFTVSNNPANKAKNANNPHPHPHSTPNKEIIIPHIAMRSLLNLGQHGESAVILGLNSSSEDEVLGALATAKFLHSEAVVNALIAKAKSTPKHKDLIAKTLMRLHQQEKEYNGVAWWGTRPNPDGPYYYPTDWSGTKNINSFLSEYVNSLEGEGQKIAINLLKKNKAYVSPFNPAPRIIIKDPKKPGDKKMENVAIEDTVLYLKNHKGNAVNGAKVMKTLSCAACHNTTKKETIKGPDLAALGNMSKADLAEAIIKPNASIAKSWVTITLNDGTTVTGTIVKQDKKEIVVHNIGGVPTTIDANKIKSTAPGLPMMGLGLCDKITLQEFTDLVEYIQALDENRKVKK